MTSMRKSHPIAAFSTWFLVIFLVLFPKGGIKIAQIPLTWGYLFLAISAVPLLFVRLLSTSMRLPKAAVFALLSLVPFQLLFLYAGELYGVENSAFTVSTATSLFILPWLFVFVYPPFLRFVDGNRLSFWLRWCVTVAALWGIFLFFWHTATGHYIEIPYLTVNADDFGQLELTKHIARGNYFKLISTYNNGNLYGVCMLILLPLLNVLEGSFWRRSVLKLALLMTLSRTVWVGLVLEQGLSFLSLLGRQFATFPRVYLGKTAKRLAALIATIIFIFFGLLFNSSSLAFLFDSTGGGRVGEADGFFSYTWLPSHALYGFDEILYVSAGKYWGYFGLIAFTLMMLSPVLLLLVDSSALANPGRRAALKGLTLYIFLAAIDGAYNFIPTMAFYWFLFMIYIFGWPRFRNAIPHSPEPQLQPALLPAEA